MVKGQYPASARIPTDAFLGTERDVISLMDNQSGIKPAEAVRHGGMEPPKVPAQDIDGGSDRS
jgi:hypothetical protein